MASSSASSPLRLELARSRLRVGLIVALGLLAAVAILASAIPLPLGALLFAFAGWVEWRRFSQAQPIRLRWNSDGSMWLDWPDGSDQTRQQSVEPLAVRRVGALTVLQLRADGRRNWLALWPDSLSAGDRKSLRRRLLAGLPGVNSG